MSLVVSPSSSTYCFPVRLPSIPSPRIPANTFTANNYTVYEKRTEPHTIANSMKITPFSVHLCM